MVSYLNLSLYAGFVFLIMFGIMIMSSKMECSQQNLGIAALESGIFSLVITALYFGLGYAPFLTEPIERFAQRFFSSQASAHNFAEAYVLMICSWPLIVYTILQCQRKTCQKPSESQIQQFKEKLVKNLQDPSANIMNITKA